VTGGEFYISVPNLGVLCQLFVAETVTNDQRFHLMRIMFGGQVDPYDFHKVGFIEPFLTEFLKQAGFSDCKRVKEFNLFDDTSSLKLGEYLISLNLIATK
jgi:predicted SAM-dependent methyltransferase